MAETLNLAGHLVALTAKQTERGVLVTLEPEDQAAGFVYTLLAGAKRWCGRVMSQPGCTAHAYADEQAIRISAIGHRDSILSALPSLHAELRAEVQRQVSHEHDFELATR